MVVKNPHDRFLSSHTYHQLPHHLLMTPHVYHWNIIIGSRTVIQIPRLQTLCYLISVCKITIHFIHSLHFVLRVLRIMGWSSKCQNGKAQWREISESVRYILIDYDAPESSPAIIEKKIGSCQHMEVCLCLWWWSPRMHVWACDEFVRRGFGCIFSL